MSCVDCVSDTDAPRATSARLSRWDPPLLAIIALPAAGIVCWGVHPAMYYVAHIFFLILLWAAACFCFLCRWHDSPPAIGDAPPSRPPRACKWLLAMPLAATLAIVTRAPMRLAFLAAMPGMNRILAERQAGATPHATSERCGAFLISTDSTRRCHVPGREIFMLADDPESGFVYSTNGIAGLCYNSGNCGWLWGNWYWMTED